MVAASAGIFPANLKAMPAEEASIMVNLQLQLLKVAFHVLLIV
jgi:hypothetical protein